MPPCCNKFLTLRGDACQYYGRYRSSVALGFFMVWIVMKFGLRDLRAYLMDFMASYVKMMSSYFHLCYLLDFWLFAIRFWVFTICSIRFVSVVPTQSIPYRFHLWLLSYWTCQYFRSILILWLTLMFDSFFYNFHSFALLFLFISHHFIHFGYYESYYWRIKKKLIKLKFALSY